MKKFLKYAAIGLGSVIVLLVLYVVIFVKHPINLLVPSVERINAASVRISHDSADVGLELTIQNKGIFRMNIDSLYYHVNFDTIAVSTDKLALHHVLGVGEIDTILMPCMIASKKLVGHIKQLQGTDSTSIVVNVDLVHNTLWGRQHLKKTLIERVAVPIPPEFAVKKVRIAGKNGDMYKFKAEVQLINRGHLKLDLDHLTYEVTILDKITAEGMIPEVIHIRPKSVFSRELVFEAKVVSPFKTAAELFRKRKHIPVHLRMKGIVRKGFKDKDTEIDVAYDGDVSL